jgi:hypothetical protein
MPANDRTLESNRKTPQNAKDEEKADPSHHPQKARLGSG